MKRHPEIIQEIQKSIIGNSETTTTKSNGNDERETMILWDLDANIYHPLPTTVLILFRTTITKIRTVFEICPREGGWESTLPSAQLLDL